MSLFLGNSGQYAHVQVNPEKMKQAEIQFSATAATFNSILSTCESKCINREYGESELTTGEAVCVDRCVSKYVKANAHIGTNFQSKGYNPYSHMKDYEYVQRKLQSNNNE